MHVQTHVYCPKPIQACTVCDILCVNSDITESIARNATSFYVCLMAINHCFRLFVRWAGMGAGRQIIVRKRPLTIHQGSTLAMCPLARMHFLGRRASSGHNNSFYAGPRGQWLSDRWQTHVPVFSVDVSRAAV